MLVRSCLLALALAGLALATPAGGQPPPPCPGPLVLPPDVVIDTPGNCATVTRVNGQFVLTGSYENIPAGSTLEVAVFNGCGVKIGAGMIAAQGTGNFQVTVASQAGNNCTVNVIIFGAGNDSRGGITIN